MKPLRPHIILKFGILCVLLPFYGYIDEWAVLLRSLCKSTNQIWNQNLKAFKFIGIDYIRETKPMWIESIKALVNSKYHYHSAFNLMIKNYKYHFNISNTLFLFLKLANSMNFDQALVVHKVNRFKSKSAISVKIIPRIEVYYMSNLLRIDPNWRKNWSTSDFYDKNALLLYSEYIKRNTVIFEQGPARGKINMYAVSHFSIYINCKQLDGYRGDYLEDDEIKQMMETNHPLFNDVTICSWYLKQYIEVKSHSSFAKNIKRFHILAHFIIDELSLIKAFVDCHNPEFAFHVTYQYKSIWSIGYNSLITVPCSVLIMLDSKGSFLVVESEKLSIDFEYIQDIDFKDLSWIPLTLKNFKWNVTVRKSTLIHQEYQESIKLCQSIKDSECFPIIFINKDKIDTLNRINLSFYCWDLFPNIRDLCITIDINDKSELQSMIECLNTIPNKANLKISINSDRLNLILKNEQIAFKLQQFSNLEVNWLKQFTYCRNENLERFLIITSNNLYIIDEKIDNLDWSSFGHKDWKKTTNNCFINNRCNMIKDLLIPFI